MDTLDRELLYCIKQKLPLANVNIVEKSNEIWIQHHKSLTQQTVHTIKFP